MVHPGDFKTESSLQFYMPDVSFAIPQRKKLTLEVTGGNGYLRTRNQTSKEVEFGVAMDKIRMSLLFFFFSLGFIYWMTLREANVMAL